MRSKRSLARRWLAGFTALVLVTGAGLMPGAVAAHDTDDMVLDWNRYAVEALSNPVQTATVNPAIPGAGLAPPVAAIHLAIVQGAVYDAVNRIDRGHRPYLSGLPLPNRFASKAAAAATAAHDVLVGLKQGATSTPVLPAIVISRLDILRDESLAEIGNSTAKRRGIRIGAQVAAAMLANRATDGRFGPFRFTPGTGIGQWRPTPPAFGNDPNAWIARVRPFTFTNTAKFRTAGPAAVSSAQYVAEFNEVKALGARTGSTRTTNQTVIATFHSGNPFPMLNRALRQIAVGRRLSLAQQARLFVMSSMSSADAAIGCWDDKAHWNWWRPITAIREADDGNPQTTSDPNWLPLTDNPPYPDHPAGYACFAAAMMTAARVFFGTDIITFQLTSSVAGTTPRTYRRLTAVVTDVVLARIWNGYHFRSATTQGALLGQKTARWVASRFFVRVN